jgi:hypothetical protein
MLVEGAGVDRRRMAVEQGGVAGAAFARGRILASRQAVGSRAMRADDV